jgi:hypothetical protein
LFGVALFVPPLFGINFPPERLRQALRPVHMWAGRWTHFPFPFRFVFVFVFVLVDDEVMEY